MLVFSVVVKSGDVIVVEMLMYYGIFEFIDSFGMFVFEVEMCLEEGIDFDCFVEGFVDYFVVVCFFLMMFLNFLGVMMLRVC